MPVFLVYAACAFASGFALRLVDPIVLPVAGHFAVSATAAAMLNTAYALPYALAQPFLGPIGDRFGKARCIQVCVAGLARCSRPVPSPKASRSSSRRASAPASSPAA
jgi:MFS family permease